MTPERALNQIEGKTFTDERIELDGQHFKDCTFVRCVFVWNTGPFWMSGECKFIEHRQLVLVNPIAAETVDVLKVFNFLDPDFAAAWRRG